MSDHETGRKSDGLEEDESHLEGLGQVFLKALELRRKGNVDKAKDLLRIILRREPRLPEPHLEMAHLYLDTLRLGDAEVEAREALRLLHAGGQWTDDIPEKTMLAMAHGVLAEILRRRTESDEVVFGDPQVFRTLLAETRQHFAEASRLDPENEHAGYHDFFLGLEEENPADGG